ncbi:hypothetical protein [Aquimarina algiphila]|uniref:Uncharacterized protein n=1 Tax=Aquimarina algiphila TaxID=2047982 RepID=A0A554VHI4_9FLAO|nr:hypothetical protein [Aquimarina algiphila]TSE06978.1 hypothetical protein FOF46_17290 [Aquimarina algiphila]
MENKLIIDLSLFIGKTPNELRSHIDLLISNIKCDVELPGRNGIRTEEVRLVDSLNFKKLGALGEYKITEIINQNDN